MDSTPLLKFCFLSLCLHVALAVHVLSVGVLDATQISTILDITTESSFVNAVANRNPISDKPTKKPVHNKVADTHSLDSNDRDTSTAEAAAETLPSPADGGLITEGLRPLNMIEINKSIRRTQEAIEKNIEGQIRMKLLVDQTGTVKKVTAINSLGYGLDKVAMDAAWQLRFIAAKIKSQNVALETYYTVKFTLTHQ